LGLPFVFGRCVCVCVCVCVCACADFAQVAYLLKSAAQQAFLKDIDEIVAELRSLQKYQSFVDFLMLDFTLVVVGFGCPRFDWICCLQTLFLVYECCGHFANDHLLFPWDGVVLPQAFATYSIEIVELHDAFSAPTHPYSRFS
jgi:hypothetical protein